MTAPESAIDRRIERAAAFYRSSDTSVKYVAIIAGNVVGTYGDGATQAIADRIQRSVATVQNYAHAKWMYDYARLSSPGTIRVTRVLWRKVPVSHWWLAYDEIHSRGYSALAYLYMAYDHGWSGRQMLQEFRAEWERDHGAPPPVPFERKWQNFKAAITNVLADFDELSKRLTPPQMDALRVVVEAFTEAK